MFFRKKPKPPLAKAIALLSQASDIAYTYVQDADFQPTKDDLVLFDWIHEALLNHHKSAWLIARMMKQRFRGKLDDIKKEHPEGF